MTQQINLFNPLFLKRRKYFSLVAILQAWALIVLGALIYYEYASHQVERLSVQAEASRERLAAEQARFLRYAKEFSPQQVEQQLQAEVQRQEQQVVARKVLIDALKSGELGNSRGFSDYMRAFARQVVPGLWLTGFHINGDGTRISLTGDVLDPQLLPEFIQRLGREPVMRGKTFTVLQMQRPQGATPAARYVEFTLSSGPGSEVGQ